MAKPFLSALFLGGGFVYVLPQVYVGTYSNILGPTVHDVSSVIILLAGLMAAWNMMIGPAATPKKMILWGLLLAWACTVFLAWRWLYYQSGQSYKNVWLYAGILTPLWALVSVAFLWLLWRGRQDKSPSL